MDCYKTLTDWWMLVMQVTISLQNQQRLFAPSIAILSHFVCGFKSRLTSMPVGDPGFSWGGGANSQNGIILQFFPPKTAWKQGGGGGGCLDTKTPPPPHPEQTPLRRQPPPPRGQWTDRCLWKTLLSPLSYDMRSVMKEFGSQRRPSRPLGLTIYAH